MAKEKGMIREEEWERRLNEQIGDTSKYMNQKTKIKKVKCRVCGKVTSAFVDEEDEWIVSDCILKHFVENIDVS